MWSGSRLTRSKYSLAKKPVKVEPFIPHVTPCQGAKCRSKAMHETLKGIRLCPTCFERCKDKDFKVKR